jgi:D-xylose transport system permease protein
VRTVVKQPETNAPSAPKPPESAGRPRIGRKVLGTLAEHDALAAIFAVFAVAVYFQTQTDLFLSSTNVNNLVVEIVPLALLGLAASVVILARDIDLSLGSMVGLTAAIGAVAIQNGRPWWVAILMMLAAGAALGGAQGAIVVVAKVPAFIVTLGGYLVFLGLQLDVLGGTGGVSIESQQIQDLTTTRLSPGTGLVAVCAVYAAWLAFYVHGIVATRQPERWWLGFKLGDLVKPVALGVIAVGGTIALNRGGGIPLAFLLTIGIFAAVAGFLSQTATGRHVYAIGDSPEATRRAGVRVEMIRWGGFVVAGALAACGGLMYLSIGQGASTTTGGGTLLLEAIGAAVIGGVSLFGGRGNVWGALAGAFVMGGIANGLNFTSQTESTKFIVQGGVVVAAVVFDSLLRRGGFSLRWPTIRRSKRTPGARRPTGSGPSALSASERREVSAGKGDGR